MTTIDPGETLVRLVGEPKFLGTQFARVEEHITIHFQLEGKKVGIFYIARPTIVLPFDGWQEMRLKAFSEAVLNPCEWVLELLGSLYKRVRGVSPLLDLTYGHYIS